MAGTASPRQKRNPLRRLLHLFHRSSSTPANRAHPSSSTSPATSTPTHAKPTSSTPSSVRPSSSCQSVKLDPGGRLASQTSQTGCLVQPCPTAAVAVGQVILNRALELLSPQERATIEEHIIATADDIISAVGKALNAAQKKQNLCENKRWTFTFGGHTVTLREEADKVLLWLDRFKQVGDIAVNADPIHAGLPWAGIRLLLEVRKDNDYFFQASKISIVF
jgi:hypothetical protein